jgi:FHA domain-containing protein
MVDKNPKPDKEQEEIDEYLRRIATRTLGDTDFEESEPRWGTARFGSRMNLLLFVRGVKEPFVFDAEAITELIIGRFDPDTGKAPDVDLQNFDAAEKGVSRRHASIIRRDGQLNIVDSGSDNGTYLNGQRLMANQPRILRDGDDIRLGHLVLRAKYARIQDPRPG